MSVCAGAQTLVPRGLWYHRLVLRRDAISVLLAACANARASSRSSLRRFFDDDRGTAVLVDVKTRRLIGVHGAAVAGGELLSPGSTIKPFVLATLLHSGKLRAEDTFVCPGKLSVGGHSFNCSHPVLGSPLQVRTALAYSCNSFVAHYADRFEPGELASGLERAGLASVTGWFGDADAPGRIERARGPEANRLQALGEDRVWITAAELAMGYRWLALGEGRPEMRAVVEGLAGAVEYGTAQLARVDGMAVAGKTGSSQAADGARTAWFAGFAPAAAPEVAIAVMLQGRSGGTDAAPVAGKILAAYRVGRL
ncbi:MAG TPA: penicillin-binding transpeptidase domain-containing protein [Bryobacteraceae bacterium]|nr:penicillin-binding transpeptidase domain-containing protein [Bryobacteraceae bacterium]